MNQKSLDKKCPHLNCLVYHPDGICNCDMARYCPQCKEEKTESLDKKKNKELDLKEQWLIHTYKNVDSDANENIKKLIRQIALDDWKFINSLLTQQRTALLEEIKKLPDLTTTEFGEETISRLEVINLINKKDETKRKI